jgi:hypothetical protein
MILSTSLVHRLESITTLLLFTLLLRDKSDPLVLHTLNNTNILDNYLYYAYKHTNGNKEKIMFYISQLSSFKPSLEPHPLVLASMWNDVNTIKQFNYHDMPNTFHEAMQLALRLGHVEVVKYLVEQWDMSYTSVNDPIWHAYKKGHWDLFYYLLERMRLDKRALRILIHVAVSTCSIEKFHHLYTRVTFDEKTSYNIAREACMHGSKDIFQFILGKIEKPSDTFIGECILIASGKNFLGLIKYLYYYCYKSRDNMLPSLCNWFSKACKNNNVQVASFFAQEMLKHASQEEYQRVKGLVDLWELHKQERHVYKILRKYRKQHKL